MISNYVKLGYLRRPVKKQYDREQIAALLFIAVSKQVLSMDNIGKLFRMQVELGSMEESYTAFKADFDYLLDSIWNQKVMDSGQVRTKSGGADFQQRKRRQVPGWFPIQSCLP